MPCTVTRVLPVAGPRPGSTPVTVGDANVIEPIAVPQSSPTPVPYSPATHTSSGLAGSIAAPE